jgi:CheY-like chemotaxis protein
LKNKAFVVFVTLLCPTTDISVLPLILGTAYICKEVLRWPLWLRLAPFSGAHSSQKPPNAAPRSTWKPGEWLITIRILIADDSAPVRHGLRQLIESNPNWEICGEAADGAEAVELAKKLEPDLVVLDLSMPIMNGLQAAERIGRLLPNIPMLLCTMYSTADLTQHAKNTGISGLVWKSQCIDGGLAKGIETLLRREEFFPAPEM